MFLKKIGNCPQLNFGVLFWNTLSTHFITLCSLVIVLIVIVTIVPFLNDLHPSWCSVKMAHCGGFVRKPRKRLESTQCSCTTASTACCGDSVSLLLYQGACCLGLLVLKFKCTARPPYYLPLRHIAVNDHDILIIRETGRPVQYSLWTAYLKVSLIDLQILHARSIWCFNFVNYMLLCSNESENSSYATLCKNINMIRSSPIPPFWNNFLMESFLWW